MSFVSPTDPSIRGEFGEIQIVVNQGPGVLHDYRVEYSIVDQDDDILQVVDVYINDPNSGYSVHLPEAVDALVQAGLFQWPPGVDRDRATKQQWLQQMSQNASVIFQATQSLWEDGYGGHWYLASSIPSEILDLATYPRLKGALVRGPSQLKALAAARLAKKEVAGHQVRSLSQCGQALQDLQDRSRGKKCPSLRKEEVLAVAQICNVPGRKDMTVQELCRAIVSRGSSRLRQLPPEVIEGVLRKL